MGGAVVATSRYAGKNSWPAWRQELLLQAALIRGPKAIDAWDRWKSSVDFESLDHESNRLLPQLYDALRRHGISDPLMGRLKGTYRRTWFENQLLFQTMSRHLRSLHEAGIQTMVLKGAALVSQYYRDYGLRRMYDLDILVPSAQVAPALKVLRDAGFVPDWDTRDEAEVLATRHGWDFKDAGGQNVDLHWRVFHDAIAPVGDVAFWEGAVPVAIHGAPSKTLNTADQLLHVCVHGATWMDELAVHWVADATTILRAVDGALDWDRLLVQARRYHYTELLRVTLTYLRDVVDAPVPSAVLRRMNQMPASCAARIVYKAKTRPLERWGPWVALGVRYLEHSATLPADAGVLRRLAGFLKYFGRRWGTGSMWQTVAGVAFRGMRRIGWVARAHVRQMVTKR